MLPRGALCGCERGVDDGVVRGCGCAEQADVRQSSEVDGFSRGQVARGLALLREPRDGFAEILLVRLASCCCENIRTHGSKSAGSRGALF